MTWQRRTRFRDFAWCLAIVLAACAPTAREASAGEGPHEGARGEDWPAFRGPRGDGRSTERSLKLAWGADGPPVLWHRPAGDGHAAPAAVGDRLFFFDRVGDRARLSCLDAETGEEIWRSEYPTAYDDLYGFGDGPRASPVVDGARVYTFGAEGRLRCHDTATGRVLWEIDTAARFGVVQNFFGVASSPVVFRDLLIVPVGGSPPGSPEIFSGQVRGNGSGVVALDKASGKERYRVTDELASYATPVLARIGDRDWAFVFARGGLVGLDPVDGKVDFRFPWRSKRMETVNAASPVVVGDTVLVSEGYGPGSALLRVRPGGQEVLWKNQPRDDKGLRCHWNTPVHHEGHLYGSSGQSSGEAELRCVELFTGRVLWRKSGLGHVSLIYVDGHFIVFTEDGRLLSIVATTEGFRPVGDVRLTLPGVDPPAEGRPAPALLAYPAWGAPVLSRGRLYLRGKDRLACIDLRPVRVAPATRD